MKKKLLHIAVFFLIGILLLSVNIIRNYFITNAFTGSRTKGIVPLIENIKYYGNVLCDWLPFFGGISQQLLLLYYCLLLRAFVFRTIFFLTANIILVMKYQRLFFYCILYIHCWFGNYNTLRDIE